ncbi:hypothetical protein L1987_61317 [Smallanthus sonchifolius]|uniref:Uncharacterized protein n=1 Tax=Smallanthus sonchifolius TaxID=185202 RepID=A0ACB9DBC5_9ASTR|nr:hypothetical protein L1987_61317 [Smallanthus sonchifolius]
MPSTLSLITTTFLLLTTLTTSQPPPAPAPPPASDSCNGIFLSYTYTSGSKLPPDQPSNQPYRFESTLTILNNAAEGLKSWRVFVGFQHDEYLVSASNAVIADGSVSIPGRVGNGTVFAGFPSADLKTAIETAGDVNQMSGRVDLVGTQFGVGSRDVPMPSNISLVNDGFVCPTPSMQGTRVMNLCCTKDPNAVTNTTVTDEFLPRQTGDLTIMYDVIRTYESDYWAEVTIENHNSLGQLDNWNLTWDWMRD